MEDKKDKFEDFILENRDDFDVYEPSPDVWDKIIIADEEKESSFAEASEDEKVRSINWMKISWNCSGNEPM